MKDSYARLPLALLRVGYIFGLLVIVFPINLLALIDIYRYAHLGLSIRPALRLAYEKLATTDGFHAVVLVLFFATLVPIVIASIRVISRTGPKRSRLLSARNLSISLIYIILCLLLGFFYILTKSLEVISGYTNLPFRQEFNFNSLLTLVLNFGGFTTIRILSFGLIVIYPVVATIIAEIAKPESTPRKWFDDFASRASLADLNGNFYPDHGRHRLNFNAAAVAPTIRFVRVHLRKHQRDYQQKIPGSTEAANYLETTWSQCKNLLFRLLGEDPELEELRLRLFSGTSRAFEATLREIPGDKRIILSPYEHQAEHFVARWLREIDRYELSELIFDDFSFWEASWDSQKSWLIEKIINSLSIEKTNVVVVSEVCYATGLVIPVNQIVNGVRNKLTALRSDCTPKVEFIIDGAHAVGNMKRPKGIRSATAYIFSGHKWLMAPEPCGIAVNNRTRPIVYKAYDCWDNCLPESTSGATMVVGLYTSLKLLEAITVDKRWSRSQTLRQEFINRKNSKIAIIGEETGLEETCMLSIRPITGYRWKWGLKALWEYLCKANTVNAEVLGRIDPSIPWVRLSFPYFLDSWEIDRLCRILDEAVETI